MPMQCFSSLLATDTLPRNFLIASTAAAAARFGASRYDRRRGLPREFSMQRLDASDIRPFIPARDFAVSKRFYARLGWGVDDVGPRLALVTLGEAQHFYIQDYYLKDVAENTMLHLSVTDADGWYAHVAAALAGGEFPGARVQPPARQPYGAAVTFVHDPSGVLLHLCEWD
jgi:catechol 2,3-dioxygenase-like lactoylglutathione lyase family enzyme